MVQCNNCHEWIIKDESKLILAFHYCNQCYNKLIIPKKQFRILICLNCGISFGWNNRRTIPDPMYCQRCTYDLCVL